MESLKAELDLLEIELNELVVTSMNSSDVDQVLKQRVLQMEESQASLSEQLTESGKIIAGLQSELNSAITLSVFV